MTRFVAWGFLVSLLVACSQRSVPGVPPVAATSLTNAQAASSYRVLYSFGSMASGACCPEVNGGVVALGGMLYGSTGGGRYKNGTIYAVDPASGEARVIYNFRGGKDACNPSSLIVARHALYGVGGCGPSNAGTIFSVTPEGQERVLYAFTGKDDGSGPEGPLLFSGGGFYGVTEVAGEYGDGTVFGLGPNGAFRVLYSFGAHKNDGHQANGGLIMVTNRLYGTTPYGGPPNPLGGCGTLYSLTLDGSEKILVSFDNGDGEFPNGGLVAVDDAFYGTSPGMLPTEGSSYVALPQIFRVSFDGHVDTIYSFQSYGPSNGLVYGNGKLFGSTPQEIFELNGHGGFRVLHRFCSDECPDGGPSYSPLFYGHGTIYGTTSSGGAYNKGVVFALTP
jgi:uncharacterized repeat protein (TIGR03803 family)